MKTFAADFPGCISGCATINEVVKKWWYYGVQF